MRTVSWTAAAIAVGIGGCLLPVGGSHNLSPATVFAEGLPDGDNTVVAGWNTVGGPSAGGHVDNDRRGIAGDSLMVSGKYVTAADNGFAGIGGSIFPIILPGDNELFPNGVREAAPNRMLCDLEVLGDGTVEDPLDEPWVDMERNEAADGTQDEGDWDDGGIGGACHWALYPLAPYNTVGCPAGVGVNAEDAVLGPLVWIGAACDQVMTVAGVDQCGADGQADTILFGRGNGHGTSLVTYPPFPDCPVTVGQAMVFVLTGTDADTDSIPGITVSAPTNGWIE